MSDKQTSYVIRTDSNAKSVGDEGADALQRLKSTIEGSQSAFRQLGATMRTLKGSSDEVKAAKERLGAQMQAEQSAISAASLSLLKQGSSYGKLAEEAKKAAASQKRFIEASKQKELEQAKAKSDEFGKGIDKLGGPLGSAIGRLSSLKSAFVGTGGGAMAVLGPIAAAVAVIGLVAGAAIAAGAAVVDLTATFLRWLVVSADTQRSAALDREAWLGSAQQATALGHQIDALAAKVPTAKAELQKLALETNKAFAQSYASGQGIVDTFNVIGTASAAMGDQVGNQLGDIIKRAKDFGRVQITPLDLRGTTISLNDVATQLSKTMGVSVAQAESALRSGTVKIDAAAAALRAAVEKRFGPINAKKLISLDALKTKLSDTLGALTKDVNLEPLLEGLGNLVHMLDQSTVSGAALKGIIDVVSKELGPVFEKLVPIAQAAFDLIVLQALRLISAALDVRDRWREAFQNTSIGALSAQDAINALSVVIEFLGDRGVASVHNLGRAFEEIGKVVNKIESVLDALGLLDEKSKGAGKAVGTGLADGIKAGTPAAIEASGALGDAVSAAFKGKLGIHSPSTVFHKFGDDGIDEGVAGGIEAGVPAAVQATRALGDAVSAAFKGKFGIHKFGDDGDGEGVEAGAPRVQAAVDRMAPSPPSGGGSSSTSAGGGASIVMHVTIDARGAGPGVAEQLESASFKNAVLSVFEGALKSAGIPVQATAVAA